MDDWRPAVLRARKQVGVSREELARLCGVSAATVRSYESGRRRPTRKHLEAIVWVLNVPFSEANEILEAAGFAPRRTRFLSETHPRYYYERDGEELREVVEQAPWPEFVVDDAVEVVAANRAVQAVWDIDLARERAVRSRVRMNLLSVASDHRFADRVVNWEEVIAAIASVLKARPQSLDDPAPYFDAVLAEFARGDPAYLARLADVWAKTPAHDSRSLWHYPVVWRDEEFGEMRFQATVAVCSEPEGTSFNSWHPIDAETWTVLERVKARHRASK